jgi:hypothetical protein
LDYKYAIIEGKGYNTMRYLPTQALKMKLSVITRAPRGGPTVQAGPFLVTVVVRLLAWFFLDRGGY